MLNSLFNTAASSLSPGYFVRQLLVILALFVSGFIISAACRNIREDNKKALLLETALPAFPAGLATFAIMAYFMLVVGIPYSSVTVLVVYAVITALFAVLMVKRKTVKEIFDKGNIKALLIIVGVVIVLACFACSGIMPISLSNDSMYYFHEYPKDIVYFGHLRDQFDAFLTDTGLGAVSIETLPFLFGYNEGFGVREFMHINFSIYFTMESYRVVKSAVSEKKAALIAIITGLILVTSSPVWILGHWAMANMYFMEYFFMGSLGLFLYAKHHDNLIIIPAIMCIIASLVRVEGGIFLILLALCATLLEIDGRELSMSVIFPVFILTLGYSLKIFLCYTFDNIYIFMNPMKAAVQSAAFICVSVYVIFIRKHLPKKLLSHISQLFLAGFFGVNVLLLIYKSDLYLANLKAFYLNLTRQSGWGMLPVLSFGAALIIIVFNIKDLIMGNKKEYGDASRRSYFLVLTLGFVLVTLAVSFMRGDPLAEQVGDSGNRVLLQVAPLIIYTLLLYFVDLYERIREE